MIPAGGHNPLEPAQFGVAIVTGISYQNFRDIVERFLQNHAVRIAGAAELPLAFMELLDSPAERKAMGQRALDTVQQQKGATGRTVLALAELMSSRGEA